MIRLKRARPFLVVLCLVPVGVASTEDATYGSWIHKPYDEWPRIALMNQIEYTDKKHPVAACGFLVDTGDEILAATAKHVLIYFKSETMESVSFRGTLKAWRMSPKDSPGDEVLVEQLINENPKERLKRIPTAKDWLLFTIKQRSEVIQPLKLRRTPLTPGEKVYVVGWRYTDEGPQHIREGEVVRSEKGSVLVSIESLADNTMPGLSGAPVIDARGYVIGLMSTKAGKLQRLSATDYPQQLLEARSTAAP
jgi:hypothetical protein